MNACMQELCDDGELRALPAVCATLAETLASPLFDDEYVDGLLVMVEDLYPAECAALSPIVAERRVRGPVPPPELCASLSPPLISSESTRCMPHAAACMQLDWLVSAVCKSSCVEKQSAPTAHRLSAATLHTLRPERSGGSTVHSRVFLASAGLP